MATNENARQDLPYSLSTLSVHADDSLNRHTDVAPPIHLSTTFRYSDDPELLVPINDGEFGPLTAPVYSRLSSPTSTRIETILSSLLHGHALTYSSGLSAFHALLTFLNPKVVAIGGGYHGCHGVLDLHSKLSGCKKVDLFDDAAWDEAKLGKGDLVHVESPINPTGEAVNIVELVEKSRKRGAYVSVDATFAPPPLMEPFKLGADIIMHSGTKYLGGHSDLLCGVLVTKNTEWWEKMFVERIFLGSVMGGLEGWLAIRSLRTLELRVLRQSGNAEKLVRWIHDLVTNGEGSDAEAARKVVAEVKHASLQTDQKWVKEQLPNGFGPVFVISMKSRVLARTLPSKLRLFHHATSLGGVESLIEWRKMSDATVDDRVLRVSIGVENWEDLRDDMLYAFQQLATL
ncbi:cystathionine beta-lyase [Eremomyces bilateralis CBS 781.70]|uniref:Cystathionine beta-lyase n=1 Tax=Eremomyces bilateralis CBS 781.70 TaxID=1392243 RepID=A0A6G1FUG2_9PEZI|nr:cystathionine beta-lyase [Eremomyces bilateralis CBS 781.70]KAF1809390.1 cystathionine beta-lyase [Eremomyces bilateralis CBS 781.70]